MDAKESGDSLALTSSKGEDSILFRSRTAESIAFGLLSPLKKGRPVILAIEDTKLKCRKRAEHPVLFLTPMSVYGPPSSLVVASFQTFGCEVFDTLKPINPMVFFRLGINIRLSKALAQQLNLVFNQKE